MLQKFKITSYAFILCFLALPLTTVSYVFAEDSPEFVACTKGKGHMKEMINCFRDLVTDDEGTSPMMLQSESEAAPAWCVSYSAVYPVIAQIPRDSLTSRDMNWNHLRAGFMCSGVQSRTERLDYLYAQVILEGTS